MGELVTVGDAAEIAEGEAEPFDVNGREVAVARVDGVLYAFSDICTHRGCNLALGGEIEGNAITCECHGSTFDIRTGEVLGPPATEPLAIFGVREDEGTVQVEV
jgi:3-phenylpropionate/trans-cinnamate dioxygenase ferredoxin component